METRVRGLAAIGLALGLSACGVSAQSAANAAPDWMSGYWLSCDDGREKNRRSVAELKARAEVLKVEREKREEQASARAKAKRALEEAAQREKHLQSLAGKEDSLWKKIDGLIKLTQPKPYDEALETLLDLRDLAAKSGAQEAFAKRAAALYAANTKRPAFAARIRKAGLA